MKVAIIGGGGRVGACAAYCMQQSGLVSEILLLDANEAAAEGEALDLLHGAAYSADQVIRKAGYSCCAQCDVVVITAGSRRKPDESRLDLMNRNVSIFLGIIRDLKSAGFGPTTQLFIVSNPVDVLTYLAIEASGLPAHRVYGLGTMLDTSRFCSFIAESLELPPTQVRAMILGEHGDSMFPLWSSATVDGFPLTKFKGCSPQFQTQIFERTKKSGAEVISRKGGAGWAVGVTINQVLKSVQLNQKQILPVSSLVQGAYGLRDVCLSVPTVVGRDGILEHKELDLIPREATALTNSARVLKENISKVEK